jgi:hypothetical protein
MFSIPRHPDEGTWRAYLDKQLPVAKQSILKEHLTGCVQCTATLTHLQSQADAVSAALSQAVTTEPATGAAWQRFRTRKVAPVHYSLSGRMRTMQQNMRFRSWRPALLGVLLVTLVVSMTVITPLRTAASQFLGIFRVRKFAVISIDPAQMKNLAGFEQQVFVNPRIDEVKPVTVANTEEAGQLAGFRVLAPSRLPQGVSGTAQIRVMGATTAHTEVNLAAARAVLQLANLPTDAIPSDRETIAVTARIQPVVTFVYDEGATPLSIIQAHSPEVDVPDGIDLPRLGELGLQLLGLSPAEAQRLSQNIDWATTLIIPVPSNIASVREVTVRGANGYMIRESSRGANNESTLIWEENGLLYAVVGNADSVNLVEVAESLQ